MRSGGHELRACLHRINKGRTRRREVEPPNVFRPYLVLHQASRRGKKHIRSHGGDQNRFQIVGCDAALLQSPFGSLDRKITGGDAIVHNMALANPRPIYNPVVGGFDHLLQIFVG